MPNYIGGRKVVVLKRKVAETVVPRCVACDEVVNPSWCYHGRVFAGFSEVVKAERTNYLYHSRTRIVAKIPSVNYNRGLICDKCAGEYRVYVDARTGDEHPAVMVDKQPSTYAKEEKTPRMMRTLNTRITTG